MDVDTIERVEEKFLITKEEKRILLKNIKSHLEKDEYFSEEVLSLYFDTANNDFVIRSLDRPSFREKFRIRAYNVPKKSTKVFFEVKSKLAKGRVKIGNKRRLMIPLKDFYTFQDKKKTLSKILEQNQVNDQKQLQIAKELDYLTKYYNIIPKLIIASDRTAYSEKNNKNFRLTFDEKLRFRENDLFLEKGSFGEYYFTKANNPKHCIIMEVKTMNSMPLWFVRELSSLKIYPARFSKYGKIYQLLTERKNNV